MLGLRRALALTTAERYVTLILSFVGMSILSRLLTPGEVGVFVLANSLMTLFLACRDFAGAMYLIQIKDMQLDDQRTVFTLQLLFSIVIAAALYAAGPYLAYVFTEPRIIPYLTVTALCIVIDAFPSAIGCMLRRQMDYGKLAIMGIANAVVVNVAGVVLAVAGFGYMSFAGGWLAGAVVTALTAVYLWPSMEIYRPSLVKWREVLALGSYNGATTVLEKIVEAVPYVFLGRILPLDALAIYNRSLTICQLPDKVIFGGVFSVLISAFSNHSRNGGDLKQVYLKSVENITALQWPALIVIAILAHPIVHIVLGSQWLSTIPLIQIIAIASMFKFSNDLNYPLLIACGANRDVFLKSLIVLPASAAILIVAAIWGLNAAAWSAFIYLPFQAYVSTLFNRRHVNFEWSELLYAVRKAPVLSLAAAAGPLAVVSASGTFAISIPMAMVAAVLSGLGWLLAIWLLSHPLGQEIANLYRIVHQRLRGGLSAFPAQ